MKRLKTFFAGIAAVLSIGAIMGVDDGKAAGGAGAAQTVQGVLELTMKRIDGTDENLETYRGKVVMIVNVASKCGFTSQYAGLQKIYDKYKDRGLVVLGFPSNDFLSQEPGTNKQIAEFCSSKFSVTFPMFEKVHVKGSETCELYKRLATQPGDLGGEPKWNFTKFVVDRSGKVVARFGSSTKPDSEEVITRIEGLLGDANKSSEAPKGEKSGG